MEDKEFELVRGWSILPYAPVSLLVEGTLKATEREMWIQPSHTTIDLQSVLSAMYTGSMMAHNL